LNVPLALGAIVLALSFVREPPRQREAPLDVAGASLASFSLLAITWALTRGGGHSGWSESTVLTAAAGFAALLAFIWTENRQGDAAMMPLALFSSRKFVGLTLLTLLLYGALGALLVLVPFVLIRGAGFSGTAAGAALLPFPVVLTLTSRLMGGLAGRIGPRIPLTVGPMVVAAGFLLLLRVTPSTDYWSGVFPAILVMSVGMAGAVAPLTTAVLGSVDARHTGSASGLNSAVARTGGLIATALLGAVFAAQGTGLYTAFHGAVTGCAIASFAAGAAAFLFLGRRPQNTKASTPS
jgi:predicted MFS family arabinose efflux permease